ncbi:hypothetical protein LZC95_50330 [Pendulispora brunnea]|uniref:Uncharacterized protein n=1 Tax=Pendulispora brunnea TaxID=2905690 RepID=A0ABZ2K7F7_9BACT
MARTDEDLKIELQDGRTFAGTPLDVVRAMQRLAFGVDGLTVHEYVAWVVKNTRRIEGLELDVQGASAEEISASLIREMLLAGLARRV